MKTERLKELYLKYGLSKDDVFKHQHYIIITRSGVDKIQASEKITITYDVIECQTNFCVVKAKAEAGGNMIETFGSALVTTTDQEIIKKKIFEKNKDGTNIELLVDDIKSTRKGNCNTWYVMEMAEKRAMSRACLKLTGFYELGVFGEDESEDFKRKGASWKK
jgi:hypothetical protein